MIIKTKGKLKIVPLDRNTKCFICGSWGAEEHHCMNKRGIRDKSTKYGLTVMLCKTCHNMLHNHKIVYENTKLYLKKVAQEAFEQNVGSREMWLSEFHENNL